MVGLQILMLVILEHLRENASPPLTISPCPNTLAVFPQSYVEASV